MSVLRIKIYQINSDQDVNRIKFFDFNSLKIFQGHTDINPSIYKKVFYGDVDCSNLEEIYETFNMHEVPTHQGHSLSVSDVIEIIESDNELLKGKCFFCDSIGFKTIDFESSKCAEMDGLKCVYITPHNTPIELNLEINDYDTISTAVKGLIEITHPFDDSVSIIGNEEAKLINMEGNRRVGNGIYAGPILIVGDNGGEDFIGLTQEQADRYMDMFEQPEEITDEEVQADTGCTIYFM